MISQQKNLNKIDLNQLKVTILGCGTSTGVPVIGCPCGVCQSLDPANKRLRSSVLIQRMHSGETLVVDTTPDFRTQILQARISRMDGVLYTHTHADHTHGFDDLRAFYFFNKKPIPCYLKEKYHQELKERFSYAFEDTGYLGTTPQIDLRTIPDEPFNFLDFHIETVELEHGSVTSTGFLIDKFMYLTDFKGFPEEKIYAWKGKVHTAVVSGLRFREHATHNNIDQSIKLMQDLGVEKGYLTHLNHEVDYERDKSYLPEEIEFARDGLEIWM